MKNKRQITILIIGILVAVSCLYTIISEKVSILSASTLNQKIRSEVLLKKKALDDITHNTLLDIGFNQQPQLVKAGRN